MTEAALHLHAGFLQHEHVQTFTLYVHEEVQLMLSELHARVQHKAAAQRKELMKACLLHFRHVTDSREREESARILQRHNQFDALMEITVYVYAKEISADNLQVGIIMPCPARFMHSVYVTLADACDPDWLFQTLDKASARLVLLDAVRKCCAQFVRLQAVTPVRAPEGSLDMSAPEITAQDSVSNAPSPRGAQAEEPAPCGSVVEPAPCGSVAQPEPPPPAQLDMAPSVGAAAVRVVDTRSAVGIGQLAGVLQEPTHVQALLQKLI
jgi:hypothetical protein